MTFTIRGVRETGTITYHCSTTSGAIEKVRDFHDAEYSDVTISTDDGAARPGMRVITLLDLQSIGSPQGRP